MATATSRTLQKVLAQLGEFTEHVGAASGAAGGDPFAAYRGPGGRERFALEVLRVPGLLLWQVEAWRAMETHDLLAISSANACGKSFWNAATALYECVVNGALVLFGSATNRQNVQQSGKQLKRLLARATIGASVYNYGVVPDHGAGVINFLTGEDVSALQGYHDVRVVVILDEFQGSADEMLEAAMANISGGDSVLIVTGNPLQFGTPFHLVFQRNAPGWWKRRIDAQEVLADPAYPKIPGLVTKAWIDNLRWTYGEESAVFQSRVCARFPESPSDAFFPPEAIAAAFARYENAAFQVTQQRRRRVLGVDVGASEAGDESVIAVARGGFVKRLITWRESDTMRSVGRIIDIFRELQVPPKIRETARTTALMAAGFPVKIMGDPLTALGPPTSVVVDEIGVGKGLGDRLREAGYHCTPFIASKRPEDEDATVRYANLRAEAYDRFRTMMVRGLVALPPDPLLEEELRTCRGFTNSSGKLQIINKAEWRAIIARSPDRLDACVLAVAADGTARFDGPSMEAVAGI